MASVTWRDAALDEMEDIARRISADSPRPAAEYVQKFFSASESLELFPQSGRVVPEHERTELRELIVRPYRVIYSVVGDEVDILAVHHGARLLGEIPGL
jgi:toxin ParE1/3/4